MDSPGRRIGSYPGGGPKSLDSTTGSAATGRVNLDSGIVRSPRRPPRPRRRRPRQPPRSSLSPELEDSRGWEGEACSSPEINSGWASLWLTSPSTTGCASTRCCGGRGLRCCVALAGISSTSSVSSNSMKSETYRKASRSSPISTKADCIPGRTRVTRPL